MAKRLNNNTKHDSEGYIMVAIPKDFIAFDLETTGFAAHNASFDMAFINYESRWLGYSITNRVIDTLSLSRKHYPRLENHKLSTVARHIGVINQLEHRGLYDATVVAEILIKLASGDTQAG
ncbi:MAG: exonuclease domain-containing protein [Lutispora sp.]|nr:exonuclease domain-containing protein [Lutispora sp.]